MSRLPRQSFCLLSVVFMLCGFVLAFVAQELWPRMRSLDEESCLLGSLGTTGSSSKSLFGVPAAAQALMKDSEALSADILVVGAGLSGSVLSYFHATLQKQRVLIVERRNHIAGNTFDFVDQNGIRISKYGPHFFHTKLERVWNLLTKFSAFVPFEMALLAHISRNLQVSVPVNIKTANQLMGQNISTEDEMRKYMASIQGSYKGGPKNAEEAAIERVGQKMYDLLFKGYTTKQWEHDPKDLAPLVTQRIPVRYNSDDRYFSDVYQALPVDGFEGLVKDMLDHPLITYKLGVDFFDLRLDLSRYKHVYFTGPIDRYFADRGFEALQYRSLFLKPITVNLSTATKTYPVPPLPNFTCLRRSEDRAKTENFASQPRIQINRPNVEELFTRTVDYRHLPWNPPPPENNRTTVVYEFPSGEGEPYYPIPDKRNQNLYDKYKAMAEEEEKRRNVIFVGRLANYKYFNMDAAVENAINVYEKRFGKAVEVFPFDVILLTPTSVARTASEAKLKVRNLCEIAHSIKASSRVLWALVEDNDVPEKSVSHALMQFGARHAYFSTGSAAVNNRERQRKRALEVLAEHLDHNNATENGKHRLVVSFVSIDQRPSVNFLKKLQEIRKRADYFPKDMLILPADFVENWYSQLNVSFREENFAKGLVSDQKFEQCSCIH